MIHTWVGLHPVHEIDHYLILKEERQINLKTLSSNKEVHYRLVRLFIDSERYFSDTTNGINSCSTG